MRKRWATIPTLAIGMLMMVFTSPAAAVTTYDPDPPVAGQSLTVTSTQDWAGCSATSGNWSYTQVITLIAPDGTETVFETISESGTAPSGPLTLTGSDTKVLPASAGDYTVRTTTRSFCGRLGQSSSSIGTVTVAKDATVPVADPLVGLMTVGSFGLAYQVLRRRNDRGSKVDDR